MTQKQHHQYSHMLHTSVKTPHMMTVFDHLWNGKEAQTSNLMTTAFLIRNRKKKSSVHTLRS